MIAAIAIDENKNKLKWQDDREGYNYQELRFEEIKIVTSSDIPADN